MGLNAYSGMLTVVTALNSLFGVQPGPRAAIRGDCRTRGHLDRTDVSARGDAIALLFDVLTIMLYLLVPWTAVNLVDYFFVRRGRYAITHLFIAGGIYGNWGMRGLGAYTIGFAATIPFGVLPGLYVGPAARALGGIDVGWLVGLIVSGAMYLWFCRSLDLSREESAIRESDATLKRIAD